MEFITIYQLQFDNERSCFIKREIKREGAIDDYNNTFTSSGDISPYAIDVVVIDDNKGFAYFATQSNLDKDEIYDKLIKSYKEFCERKINIYNNKINCLYLVFED